MSQSSRITSNLRVDATASADAAHAVPHDEADVSLPGLSLAPKHNGVVSLAASLHTASRRDTPATVNVQAVVAKVAASDASKAELNAGILERLRQAPEQFDA